MERKLDFSVMSKIARKFWIILLVAVIIGGVAGGLYVEFAEIGEYNITAKVFVAIETALGEGAANSSAYASRAANNWSNCYSFATGAELKDALRVKIGEVEGRTIAKDENMSGVYEITKDDDIRTYNIRVKLAKKENALSVAQVFVDYMKEVLKSEGTIEGQLDKATLSMHVYQEPTIAEDPDQIPWYIGGAIGGIVGIIVYAIFVFCVFYFDPRILSIAEFKDNFSVVVLGDDSKSNGLNNVAIKIKAIAKFEGVGVIAVNDGFDVTGLAESLNRFGDKVLVAHVGVAAGKQQAVSKGTNFDILNGTEGNVGDLEKNINVLKETMKDYDEIIIVSDSKEKANNYVYCAGVADAAIMQVDLKSSYKRIRADFEELGINEKINLLGVVF